MMLQVLGCNFRDTTVEVRERLAFDETKLPRALNELVARYDCEAVILSTCNRVELYLARPVETSSPDLALTAHFLEEFHGLSPGKLKAQLYQHQQGDAVRHLFRVAASLDSLVVGEGQITGQVKRAYELAQQCGSVGPLLHVLFQHASMVAGRVRSETGISRGHVSVSSLAVDYVRQVFDHFEDKTILVIGAGKMGELTLRHLHQLHPLRIFVTNRSPDKSEAVARECGGESVPWNQLDDALAKADIILSTTGAPEPIVTLERYERIRALRHGGLVVILDIAVPRNFDPRIHDGDRTCLFNIDDLMRVRKQTLHDRLKHVRHAEDIVEQETRRFLRESARRRTGPLIARLTEDCDAKRRAILATLMARLNGNGRFSDADRADIEGAFRLLQSQFLHGPIAALAEEAREGKGHSLREALRKLFRLQE
jgi:glutamyl-tRNA reductase